MKYFITVAKGSRKRAVAIDLKTDGDAQAYAEKLMTINGWLRSEVYLNDSITQDMSSAYRRILTCTKQDGIIVWEKCS